VETRPKKPTNTSPPPLKVWARYTNEDLIINTQASFGNVAGRVKNGLLTYNNGAGTGVITFAKPTARDIFGCSTGPFATGSNAQVNAMIPRLAAAFNRSTLLVANENPNKITPGQYYQNPVTNVSWTMLIHDCFSYFETGADEDLSCSTTHAWYTQRMWMGMATLSHTTMSPRMVVSARRAR
jgi:hypothetical protein